MNYNNIGTVIFTHPPIGVIGISEKQAIKQYGKDKVTIYKSKFTNMFYSPGQSDKIKLSSFFKLICADKGDGLERVVGCHCMGKGVDEMM